MKKVFVGNRGVVRPHIFAVIDFEAFVHEFHLAGDGVDPTLRDATWNARFDVGGRLQGVVAVAADSEICGRKCLAEGLIAKVFQQDLLVLSV